MSRSASWPILRTPFGESSRGPRAAQVAGVAAASRIICRRCSKLLRRLVAEQVAQRRRGRRRRGCRSGAAPRAASARSISRISSSASLVVERLGPVEELAVAALELLERADVVELLEQRPRTRSRASLVLEVVVARALDRVRRAGAAGRRGSARFSRASVRRRRRGARRARRARGRGARRAARACSSSASSQVDVAVALAHAARAAPRGARRGPSRAMPSQSSALAQQPVERLLHVVGVATGTRRASRTTSSASSRTRWRAVPARCSGRVSIGSSRLRRGSACRPPSRVLVELLVQVQALEDELDRRPP